MPKAAGMSWTAVRRPVIAVGAAAAFSLISLIVVKYAILAPSDPELHSALVAPPTAASVDREFSFAPHPAPRPLPDLRFADGERRALSLADFRGKLVLLNLWATWCGPCRREMPTLNRLQTRLGGPDFEVVALSFDRQGGPVVEKFYRELGLEALAVYVDKSGQVTRDLNIRGVPTTLLIDRQGREIGRVVGPAEWDGPEVVQLVGRYLKPPLAGNERPGEFREPAAALRGSKP